MNDVPSPKKLPPAVGADSEARYRSLFESSRDAMMTAEPPSGRITSGNAAALKMFGAKNQEELRFSWAAGIVSRAAAGRAQLRREGRGND